MHGPVRNLINALQEGEFSSSWIDEGVVPSEVWFRVALREFVYVSEFAGEDSTSVKTVNACLRSLGYEGSSRDMAHDFIQSFVTRNYVPNGY